ncbi:hypothetical protein JOB18_036143 [Solea senegalensis]|uniref:Uncharacterized protein n=1 Tax=Solea senegalensis TaxID=28829 RepID=A0AAV6QI21_SOLSE|nr:hypothetical protein JOB18_036143 [Solea senegalensis]
MSQLSKSVLSTSSDLRLIVSTHKQQQQQWDSSWTQQWGQPTSVLVPVCVGWSGVDARLGLTHASQAGAAASPLPQHQV